MKQILLCLTFFSFSLQGCLPTFLTKKHTTSHKIPSVRVASSSLAQQPVATPVLTLEEECLQHLPDDLKKECLDFEKLFKRSQLNVPKALLLCRNLEMYGYYNAVEYIRGLARMRFDYDLYERQVNLNSSLFCKINALTNSPVIRNTEIKYLIQEGANINARDEKERSYFLWAEGTSVGHFRITYYYATPLMKAAKNGDLDFVQFLLAHSASKTLRDSEEKTAYDYAQLKVDDIDEIIKDNKMAIQKLLKFDDTLQATVAESFEYLSTRGTNVPKDIERIIVAYAEEGLQHRR